MIRDWWMCMIISVMFEFLEYSLEHQLPNFSECWWDHVCTAGIRGFLGIQILQGGLGSGESWVVSRVTSPCWVCNVFVIVSVIFVGYKHLDVVKYLFEFVSHQRESLKLYLNAFKYLLMVQRIKSGIQRKAKLGVSLKGHPFKVMFYFPVRCKLVPDWSEFPAVRAHSSGSVFGWILGKTQAWNDLLHGCISQSQCIIQDIKPSYLAFRKTCGIHTLSHSLELRGVHL